MSDGAPSGDWRWIRSPVPMSERGLWDEIEAAGPEAFTVLAEYPDMYMKAEP